MIDETGEGSKPIDYSKYWTLIIKPDGVPTSGPVLDESLFKNDFGKKALKAIQTYRHVMGSTQSAANPTLTPKQQKILNSAQSILETKGISAAEVMQGQLNPQITKL